MAQSTEAACLLQSGSIYPARVGLRRRAGEDLFLGIKSGGFSLYFNDEPIYHFDFEGRWQRAFIDGVHYLKGLDASVRAIGRGREGSGLVLRRRLLEAAEVAAIDESIRRSALELVEGFDAGRLATIAPPSSVRSPEIPEVRELLERVAGWDAAAWLAHRERHRATYGPWPFLPPDCPSPIVLQATGGMAFGAGRTPEPSARSSEEFRDHALSVGRLLGRRTSQCRDVFLAGADVLRLPVGQVLDYLDAIGSCFDRFLESEGSRAPVVHAFLDDFRPSLPDLEGWRDLKAARLARVTLGIESGDPAIRRAHGKSWEDEALRETVANLKGAGIGVGLVVLVGAGGRALAEADLEATARLVGSLALGEGDLVSLVDARSLGVRSELTEPLDDAETADRLAAIKERLQAGRASKGPRVFPYNPEKQWA